jgi:hypothetical protein
MSTLLTKTSNDEVNISSTLSHERLTYILLMLALCVHVALLSCQSCCPVLSQLSFSEVPLCHLVHVRQN